MLRRPQPDLDLLGELRQLQALDELFYRSNEAGGGNLLFGLANNANNRNPGVAANRYGDMENASVSAGASYRWANLRGIPRRADVQHIEH